MPELKMPITAVVDTPGEPDRRYEVHLEELYALQDFVSAYMRSDKLVYLRHDVGEKQHPAGQISGGELRILCECGDCDRMGNMAIICGLGDRIRNQKGD